MHFLLKIRVSVSCACDNNTDGGRRQNIEEECKLMAYGRNCGLGKCHPLSNIHPSCPAHCANSPTALPLHTSIFLFKAEAVPTAYLLKWY